ncbi:MAG: glycine cleavage system aminomethyltransferase GcvT [Steroidobacteraceae bacterium]|nr:glycine cleavage system protein T [Nevskiaceae bacterium]MCP5339439.1 glycine cleavage system protein T [Nevskiaceae bacterium]MCP5360552.1 glycine cleavage system protein T [Nevskiaceae bacterium]MCP5472899.1 glycine cleavage system protein T [Nevskiaceae bacterium]
MGRRTPLHDLHVALGARMVDFGGWDMPVHYGSQLEEHHAVRRQAGLFDVSHMCVVDLLGEGVRGFLQGLLANDVAKLEQPGKALYSCMLNERGGVIDDLIVYFRSETAFRLVVNAGTRDKDLAWIRRRVQASAAVASLQVIERDDLAMIAVQGPRAGELLVAQLPEAERVPTLALAAFCARDVASPGTTVAGADIGTSGTAGATGAPDATRRGGWYVARTGYTGEDGFEVMLPAAQAEGLWRALNAAGASSCGLGARDTLRLEAGMNLYGNDMDESRHPLESGLAWTVAFDPPDREFVGRAALEAVRAAGNADKLVGLLLEDRGVLRGHQKVQVPGIGSGEVTSGTFSPTLERSIGFARVPRATGAAVQVDIRGKLLRARVVKPPFVRHGRALIEL